MAEAHKIYQHLEIMVNSKKAISNFLIGATLQDQFQDHLLVSILPRPGFDFSNWMHLISGLFQNSDNIDFKPRQDDTNILPDKVGLIIFNIAGIV